MQKSTDVWCGVVRAQAIIMKTYTKEVEKPRLVISHDEDAESPRAWDNIGFFLTKESNYKSPDGNVHALYSIMMDTENEAESTEHHIALMKERAKEEEIGLYEIYPVYRYEHGNVAYRRGTANGFDIANCGFYFVTESGMNAVGIEASNIPSFIDGELETYTKWCNGEVYAFTLYDEQGNVEESCGGFYDINDIREHLSDEWKDESLEDYLT